MEDETPTPGPATPQEDERDSAGAKPLSDYRQPPKGVLPKNAQTWVFLGISIAVVIVVMFFGPEAPERSGPEDEAPPTPAQSETLTEEEDVDERLADLERQMQESMRAIPRPTLAPNLPTPSGLDFPAAPPQADAGGPRDSFTDKMRELEYTSLFASNIALTYRHDEDYRGSAQSQRLTAAVPTTGQAFSTQAAFAAPPSPEQFQQMFPPPIYGGPPPLPVPSAESPPVPAEEATPAPPQPQEAPSPNPGITSKQFRLFEGTVIETALVNRLDSSFAGPIITMVTNDVYSHDRQHVLVPAGTKCIGRTTAVENLGQSRMAVSFHRLIMPDGYSVNLDQFDGLNQLGDTGLKDKVNHHYFQIFGVSIALGFLGAVSQNQFEAPFDNAGPQFARSAAQILDRFLNIAPTVTIREGHRVKVYLTQDLTLPAYDAHRIPSGI